MSSRRTFLKLTAGCAAHVFLNAACAPRRARLAWTAPQDPVVTTTPFARLEAIGADAWALISTPLGGDRTTFANGGIIAGRSGVVVVEGFYKTAGAEWLAQQARALTGRWPTHVVLTHYHVDHASGVAGFANGGAMPRVHATAPTRTQALGGGPVAPAKDAALERALADVVVVPTNGTSRIDLGNRVLTLEPFAGHTSSDLAVHDDDAALHWSGDLVWYRMFPNFVDATPTRLAASVRALATRLDAKGSLLVPGHGARITADGMRTYVGLLESLEGAARAGHAAGKPAADVAASYTVPAALGEWMASKPSVERAMTAWYKELGAR
jgi:glyoxylase-like metal-dependent hydrolase (beta-lactamase superfamily II)